MKSQPKKPAERLRTEVDPVESVGIQIRRLADHVDGVRRHYGDLFGSDAGDILESLAECADSLRRVEASLRRSDPGAAGQR